MNASRWPSILHKLAMTARLQLVVVVTRRVRQQSCDCHQLLRKYIFVVDPMALRVKQEHGVIHTTSRVSI